MQNTGIKYIEYEPAAYLKDYIKAYWLFQVKTSVIRTCEIVPDGYFDLIVVIRSGNIISTRLTGIWSKSVKVEYHEDTEVFGIRFKPLALYGLLNISISEVLDGSDECDLRFLGISKSQFADLYYQNPVMLFKYFDTWFLNKLENKNIDSRIKHLFLLVDNSSGARKVTEISKEIGISARQLQRNVTNMLGIGLKEYSKIVRLRSTLYKVKKDKTDYYPYFDQSHFIRDVKGYTGYTPEEINPGKNVRFIQYYDFIGL